MDLNEQLENYHVVGIVKPEKNTTPSEHISVRPHRQRNTRIVQNFILIWLDPHIDEENDNDFRNSITQLERVVNTTNEFTDVDQCIDFLTGINEEKVLMIISNELGQILYLLYTI